MLALEITSAYGRRETTGDGISASAKLQDRFLPYCHLQSNHPRTHLRRRRHSRGPMLDCVQPSSGIILLGLRRLSGPEQCRHRVLVLSQRWPVSLQSPSPWGHGLSLQPSGLLSPGLFLALMSSDQLASALNKMYTLYGLGVHYVQPEGGKLSITGLCGSRRPSIVAPIPRIGIQRTEE